MNSSSTIPSTRPRATLSPERTTMRLRAEQTASRVVRSRIRKMRADERYRDKMLYAYFGGSGKKVEPGDDRQDFRPHDSSIAATASSSNGTFSRSRAKQKSKDALRALRGRDRRLGGQGARRQTADGDRLRPVFHAPRRHQQAAERRLPRLDGPADEHRRQSSGDGRAWPAWNGGRQSWRTRKRCGSSASFTGTMASRGKPRC